MKHCRNRPREGEVATGSPTARRTRTLGPYVAACAFAGNACGEAPQADLTERWCDRLPRPGHAALEAVAVPDEWFDVRIVSPGVFAIIEPYQFEEVISYLVTGSTGAVLFDTGLGIGSMHEVVTRLTDLPVTVLNSHTHPDHVGGNAAFDHIAGTRMPFAERNAGGFAHEAVAEIVQSEALCRSLPPGTDSAGYEILGYEVDTVVADGTVFDLGGRRVEVIMTPGHTPDALMAIDREAGLLFTGDSYYEGPIYLMTEESDFTLYRGSIGRVAALGPDLTQLLPGHNVATSDPEQLSRLHSAVEAVATGTAEGAEAEDGVRSYDFGIFSLLIRAAASAGSEVP